MTILRCFQATWGRKTVYGGLLLLALAVALAWDGVFAVTAPSPGNYLQAALMPGQKVQRWNDQTRVIHVTIQSGDRLPGWSNRYPGLVKNAFSQWEKVLNGRIRFLYTTDPTQTDVVVKWRKRSKGMEVGMQSIRWNDQTFSDVDLEISLYNPLGQHASDQEIHYIALHEIGHMLGIRGHSSHTGDIMYPSVQSRPGVLSARDIATVRALYQRKADITNPPGVHLLQYRHYEYYIRLGYDAYNAKDYQSAYDYFTQARRYYEDKTRCLTYEIGFAAYNLQKYDTAAQYLRRAIQIKDPKQGSAQYYLANALFSSGSQDFEIHQKATGRYKLNEARRHYEAVIQNNSVPVELRKLARDHIRDLSRLMHDNAS